LIKGENGNEIIEGIFIKELKNRFLCVIEIDGEDEICYVPSSSRIDNYFDMTKKQVLLSRNKNPKSKTTYSLYAVKGQDSWILLNTNMVNSMFTTWITQNHPDSNICSEYQINKSYRCDYYVASQERQKVIEIKSVFSSESKVRYPKVMSQRLIRQLENIDQLLQQGFAVDFYFAILGENIYGFEINSELVKISELFTRCLSNGMEVYCFSIVINSFGEFKIRQLSQHTHGILLDRKGEN